MTCLTSCKTTTTHEAIELLVPLSQSLFQIVQTFFSLHMKLSLPATMKPFGCFI